MRTILIPFLITLSILPGLTAGQSYHFEKLSDVHGLSDNRVTCFLKDRSGFMWIGTENGLNRYDGHTFQVYRPGQKAYNLSHERINDIEQDNKGNLWIATWSGLNVLNPDEDSLYIFSAGADARLQKKTTIASGLVWDTYIDKTGKVWIALDNRDLCYYDPTLGEFRYFPWQEFVNTILPQYGPSYKTIKKIARKSDHELWIGSTFGLFSFNINTKTFQYHGGDKAQEFIAMQYDSLQQRVYFGQQKIFAYDLKQNIIREIKETAISSVPNTFHRSRILLPSLSGLWAIDQVSERACHLKLDDSDALPDPSEKITLFYDDALVWIGTYSGILIHDNHLNIFPFVKVFDESSQRKENDIFYVLDHEQDQTYYISSYNRNCLIILNKETGKRQEVFKINGYPLLHCTKVVEDSQHRLWVLSEQTIFISDKHHKNFSIFPFPKVPSDYQFVDMLEDTEGNFWFASLRDGVYYYNSKKKSWRLLQKESDGLFAARPKAFLSDSKHNALWIADFGYGIFRQDLKTKEFKYNGVNTEDSHFLQSSLTNALTIDKQENVWIATTSGGVSKYSQNKNEFTTYSMKTGLPENTIYSILADVNDNLWLASSKGLTVLKSSGEMIQHYDKNSGLLFNNFSTPFSTNSKNEILIGTTNGFIKFHPDSLAINSADFPVVITSALQNNRSLNSSIQERFEYNENEFNFQFAALTYSLPKQVKYYYQLKGYDKSWIKAGNNHDVRYTNLSEGQYTFLVRAIDHAGRSSSNVASISFFISPPFWKQSWFIALILMISIFSFYFWIRNLQKKIQSQKILNQVATSLYEENTIEGVFWAVARNCIELLHFEDCVVYLLDKDRGVLIQKSAAGKKSLEGYQINNPIEIKIGNGIVGTVAETSKPEIISNTKKDPRYIIDDMARLSEITVPVIVEGKLFAVIDSEHAKRNYFNRWHLHMLTEIASICSAKIGRYFAEEQIRSKVARDLHDDMGSTLSSIKILSNIALEKNDPDSTKNYLKSIRQNANTMQESMSDMVWAINPENDTLEKVIFRMKEFASEILEPLDIQYEFIEDGDFSHAKMDLNTRKDFFLIFKEAVNNAAKYSSCKNFTVELKRYARGIILRIRDDGKGFDTTLTNAGNGLKNMKHRASSIKATLQIESVSGEGTSIQLIAPIT
ncbi:MAG: two-component regulator propeller domain-containing protein [Chryseolinea sp.]